MPLPSDLEWVTPGTLVRSNRDSSLWYITTTRVNYPRSDVIVYLTPVRSSAKGFGVRTLSIGAMFAFAPIKVHPPTSALLANLPPLWEGRIALVLDNGTPDVVMFFRDIATGEVFPERPCTEVLGLIDHEVRVGQYWLQNDPHALYRIEGVSSEPDAFVTATVIAPEDEVVPLRLPLSSLLSKARLVTNASSKKTPKPLCDLPVGTVLTHNGVPVGAIYHKDTEHSHTVVLSFTPGIISAFDKFDVHLPVGHTRETTVYDSLLSWLDV